MNNSSKKEVKVIEVPDEPPPGISTNWFIRMVACYAPHPSLCSSTANVTNDFCFCGKLSRVGRFTKFY